MGPSPTIPTSFVPKQPVHSAARFQKSGGNLLMFIAMFMFIFALVGSVGVFAYGAYLDNVLKVKAAELAATEASVDTETVEEFIQFRDRFSAAGEVLDGHIAASNFFDVLEKLTLVNVRFSALTFELGDDGLYRVEMAGTARTFNALAAQSRGFAEEKLIKRAIFANIETSQTGTVSFTMNAELDPSLLVFSVTGTPTPVTPTTPSTTPASTSTPSITPTVPSSTPLPMPTSPGVPTSSPVSL